MHSMGSHAVPALKAQGIQNPAQGVAKAWDLAHEIATTQDVV